jgi:hypothetical protein
MPEEPPAYSPTTIEKVFELLDKKLVTVGIPGTLSVVGITKVRENRWTPHSALSTGTLNISTKQ